MCDTIYLYNGSHWPDNMSEIQYLAEFEKLSLAKAKQEASDSKLRFPYNIQADQRTQKLYESAFESLKEKYEAEKVNPISKETPGSSLLDKMMKQRELEGDTSADDYPF